MSYTLIIIDMQPTEFPSSRCERTVQNIIREINEANKNGASVLFVEYGTADDEDGCPSFGYTDQRLVNACKGNFLGEKNRVHFVTKSRDDGSSKIIEAINRYDYPQDFIRVCGVNTDACVMRTVTGLDSKLNEYGFNGFAVDMRKDKTIIEVVWDACNTDSPYPLKTKDFTRHCSKNVVAINVA